MKSVDIGVRKVFWLWIERDVLWVFNDESITIFYIDLDWFIRLPA